MSQARPAGEAAPGRRRTRRRLTWPGARELALFAHALRLAWSAQRLARGETLPRTAGRMTALRGLPRAVGSAEAGRAAARASVRLARWTGALDSCLVRALVVGALLSDRPRVRVHIGVRKDGDPADPLLAHAWVSEAGRVISSAEISPDRGGPYAEMLAITMER